jgi:hypothetical protein
MNYLILLVGFKDLAVRGAISELGKFSKPPAEFDIDAIIKDFFKNITADISGEKLEDLTLGIDSILIPLALKCESQSNHIEFEVSDLARELIYNGPYLINFLLESAGSLIILAHEISKDKPWHNKEPYWEFLRHCRHAAAHGSLFNFYGDEPKNLAEWGPFCLERSLNGTPLFKNINGIGLLSPGDPVRLLWDIEQAYPDMRA